MPYPIVQVNGPAGAGKSTIARRLMSLYDMKKTIDGGVGALPMGYELTKREENEYGDPVTEHKLFVLGNYSEMGRARWGMAQFNRHADDFEKALITAVGYSDIMPVFLEGGFQRVGRMKTLAGERYAQRATLVMLEPPREVCLAAAIERGSGAQSESGWDRHHRAVNKVAARMAESGVRVERFADREDAFVRVCNLLGVNLFGETSLPSSSWR